jgi:hypothetical protein
MKNKVEKWNISDIEALLEPDVFEIQNEEELNEMVEILNLSSNLNKLLDDVYEGIDYEGLGKLENLLNLIPKLKSDDQFAKRFLNKDGLIIYYLDKKLKDNHEMIKIAIKSDFTAMEYVSDEIKKDKEFCKELLDLDIRTYKFIKMFHSDKDLTIKAIKENCILYDFADDKLKNDREILEIIEKLSKENNYLHNQNGVKSALEILELYKREDTLKDVIREKNINKTKLTKF